MKRIAFVGLVVTLSSLGTAYAQNVQANGGWIVSTDTNPMDSVKTVTALKSSLQAPTSELVVRCKGRNAEVFVNVHEVVSPEYGVRVKFDQGPARRESWERATSYDALFSSAVVDFLRSVSSAKTFYFEYTPYGKSARVVSFDLGKLPESMYAACIGIEIERANARAKKAADERARTLAQQKREHDEDERRAAALRTECAQFVGGNIEKVVRSESPLPPKECWDLLDWIHSFGTYSFGAYDDLVARRNLCTVPSFSKDPNFCRE